MNDITALMATMKAAAISAKELGIIARYSKGRAAMEAFIVLATPDNVKTLIEALEKTQQRIVELERMESALRPVGVMSQAAYHRLENRESRFIALWPRPEIYLPRKRPDDGVIVYARTAGIQVIEGEG